MDSTYKIEYLCNICKAKEIKLWRQYSTFLDHIKLLCIDCALSELKEKQDIEGYEVREDGKVRKQDSFYPYWSDCLEWLVPAVPTEEMDTFWGYTSVPEDRVNWWRALPLRNYEK